MHVGADKRLLKTKIVATIGEERPAIHDPGGDLETGTVEYGTLLPWLIESGIDVIRLNMAFCKPRQGKERKLLDWLRANEDSWARNVAVLGDLPGPKIRLGSVRGGKELQTGDEIDLDFGGGGVAPGLRGASVLVNGRPFGKEARSVDGHPTIGDYVRARDGGGIFSVADGKVILRTESEQGGTVRCAVVKEGDIESGQGLTIKGAGIDVPSFGLADQNALRFLLRYAADLVVFIAVSFVRQAEDIVKVRRYIEGTLRLRSPKAPAIIAKIETREACERIDEILDVADGAMIARGDLGLQLEPQQVPAIQKDVIRNCNLRGKPVIIATQMLDSMEQQMEPTRAEVTDVFNAILDGADAVMLSGETAKGQWPVQAVRTMVRIAEEAEGYYFQNARPGRFHDTLNAADSLVESNSQRLANELSLAAAANDPWLEALYREKWEKSCRQKDTDRISESACVLSEGGDCRAIVATTGSGRTARMISRFRPEVNIVGATHDIYSARRLVLSFGVYPLNVGGRRNRTVDSMFRVASAKACGPGYVPWDHAFTLLNPGDKVIVTGGGLLFVPGTTNLVQITTVPGGVDAGAP